MTCKKRTLLSQEEVKRRELDILLAFDKFARDSHIVYSLAYGTLLGAIRHGGFIPWDDDVDVVVPRPDYEKLLQAARSGCSIGPYKMVGYEIDGFPMPFIKVVDLNVLVEDRATRSSIPLRLWIDVFPLDGCEEDHNKYAQLDKKAYLYKSLIKSANYSFFRAGKTLPKRILKMCIKPFTFLLRLDRFAEKKLADLALSGPSYEESKYVSNVVWGPYRKGERVKKRLFDNIAEVEFEGHKFKAMSGWDEYLTSVYGSYMQLPPEKDRIAHGITAWEASE